jgi:hypothetical protein
MRTMSDLSPIGVKFPAIIAIKYVANLNAIHFKCLFTGTSLFKHISAFCRSHSGDHESCHTLGCDAV